MVFKFYSSIIPGHFFLWPKSTCKYNYGALLNLLESAGLTSVFRFLIVGSRCKQGSQRRNTLLHVPLLILKMRMVQGNTQKLRVLFAFFLFFFDYFKLNPLLFSSLFIFYISHAFCSKWHFMSWKR